MNQTLISQLAGKVGQVVTLAGWVYNFRSSGGIYFLQLRDGSGFIQCVVEKNQVGEQVWQACEKITLESSVAVTGKVTEHPKKPGVYELQVTGLKIYQIAEEYPIAKKDHGPDFLLDNRHLWLRSSRQWAIQRIRVQIIEAVYDYLVSLNFSQLDSPILTSNACEGTTTLFGIDYFNLGKAYLSQSGQLYLEAIMAAHGRVFDFGPTFRAEKSKTRRHLTEFWMMDAEAAFVEHEENIKIQEGLVCYLVAECLKKCQPELEILGRDTKPLEKIKSPFSRLTYAEAVKQLQKLGSDIKDGEDLGNDDEDLLTKESEVPIFIERWPKKIKPFYMKEDPTNPDLVLNNDLITLEGAGELIGGSQREDDYQKLLTRMKEAKMPVADYQWYLDLRRYGSVPHSGFGLGLERTVGWIAGVEHVRETIPFPRMINRLKP
jgi:asparaginyl-tRNA synthetase